MKYLFINSLAGSGSTGRIAADTCRELMAQGHECCIAFGRGEPNCQDVPVIRIGTPADYRMHALQHRLLDNGGFCSVRATKAFLEQVRIYDPDVIWLHNLHGYYIHVGMLFDYLRSCGKKIIWTLHDCWAFTGHCAYFDYVGCDRWKSGCHHCPQKHSYPESLMLDASERNYQKKKAAFTGIPNLSLVVPSHWLAQRVRQSFLSEYPLEVIYNTVDETVFHPDKGDFRERYSLQNQFVILGVANVWDARKGLKDFIELSGLLPADCRIVLIGLTEKQIASLPDTILGLPRTDSIQQLVQAYSSADVHISASVEETFGMTVLEAIRCGTTAIVYRNTACQEIAEAFGGIAVEPGAENLCAAVMRLRKETEK